MTYMPLLPTIDHAADCSLSVSLSLSLLLLGNITFFFLIKHSYPVKTIHDLGNEGFLKIECNAVVLQQKMSLLFCCI